MTGTTTNADEYRWPTGQLSVIQAWLMSTYNFVLSIA